MYAVIPTLLCTCYSPDCSKVLYGNKVCASEEDDFIGHKFVVLMVRVSAITAFPRVSKIIGSKLIGRYEANYVSHLFLALVSLISELFSILLETHECIWDHCAIFLFHFQVALNHLP